jgi:hypothetical protein
MRREDLVAPCDEDKLRSDDCAGSMCTLVLPGGVEVMLYEPRHPTVIT